MRLPEGTRIPRGYGIAWYDPVRREAIAILIPFHWPLGWMRYWWLEFLHGYRGVAAIDKAMALGAEIGYERGRRDGANENRARIRAEVLQEIWGSVEVRLEDRKRRVAE